MSTIIETQKETNKQNKQRKKDSRMFTKAQKPKSACGTMPQAT